MKLIPIDQIHIAENRQRREFPLKEINELAESIQQFGLFHPIVIREENGSAVLVAGERRLRAIRDTFDLGGSFHYNNQLIPHGEVPCVSLGELNEIEREEAELDENIRRADLTWQERASATARLAALRTAQSDASKTPRPSVATIAEEVRGSSEGVHHETTRREIIVSKHLSDPDVRAAKDVNDAFKILKRKEENSRRVQLAAEVGKTFSSASHTLLNVDALEWLQTCPAGQFDVICTDPIYGIGADEFGDSGGHVPVGGHFYRDDYETWLDHARTLAGQGWRITKASAHLYAFCDITRFAEFKNICEGAGWKCFRTPIVWHKPNGNRAPWPDKGPQRKYEIVLYAVKGNKLVTRLYPDLVSYSADENLGHPAQKPVALFEDLLRRSVAPGDSVCDPFAGTGPIFPAAHALKCKATGIELDAAAYAIAMQRIERLQKHPELEGL